MKKELKELKAYSESLFGKKIANMSYIEINKKMKEKKWEEKS